MVKVAVKYTTFPFEEQKSKKTGNSHCYKDWGKTDTYTPLMVGMQQGNGHFRGQALSKVNMV